MMWKSTLLFALFVASLQSIVALDNSLNPEKKRREVFSISVDIIEEEGDSIRITNVMVNLNITIDEDTVKVNGKKTELNVRTMYELDAEIVYSENNQKRFAPVVVHFMVMRKELKNGHAYLIEEQVQIIEGKRVEQLDIKVLTIHLDVNGNEIQRTVESISMKESHLGKTKLSRYCGKDDSKPKSWMAYQKHKHEHHHKKSLCSRFHKLPLGARIAILVGLGLVLLMCVIGCATCCCRKKKMQYEVGKEDNFKAEFDIEDEAEPLPAKFTFDDKQVLIA